MMTLEARNVTEVRRAIRWGLKARGRTQTELAAHLGFTQKHVSFLLAGKARLSVDVMLRTLEWLDMPVKIRLDRP